MPSRSARSVTRRLTFSDRQPGLVDVDARLLEDEFVESGLLEPPGQRVQR
jgi:hypothetical protein